MQRPKFHDWLCDRLGPKWVVARRTKRAVEQYPDSTFITYKRFQALRTEYEARWGPAYPLPR